MRKGIYKDKTGWKIQTRIKIGDTYKTLCRRGYTTAKEADADFDRVVALFKRENEPHTKVLLFSDLRQLYRKYRSNKVRLSTLREDDCLFSAHMSELDDKLLEDVYTVNFLRDFYDSLISNNEIRSDRKNRVIKRFLDISEFAYKNEYVDAYSRQRVENIFETVNEDDVEKKEKVVWTTEQRDAFLNAIPEGKYKVLFALMWHTGMRIGELQGLMWKHYDPTKSVIYVRQQVIEGTGTGHKEIMPPKTKNSIRDIALSEDMNNLLKEYKACSVFTKDDNFIFFGDKPFSRTIFREKMTRYIAVSGVPYTTPHGARHSNATWLMEISTSETDRKIAADRLGHTPSMMINTYGHVLSKTRESQLLDKLK